MPRTRGTPEHVRPTGEQFPLHERFASELARCSTQSELVDLAQRVYTALVEAKRRTLVHTTTETADELAERILSDGMGFAAQWVADRMYCNVSFVRRARLASGRDPETGALPPDGDPFQRARELRAEGRSLRTIAVLTGIPRSTLHDRFSQRA